MAHPYLSQRGVENQNQLSVPWRFAPNHSERYNRETNINGIISFSTAENSYIKKELEEFMKEKVRITASSFDYSCHNGGPIFPGLLASFMNTYFSPHVPVTSDNIVTCASLSAVQNILAFCIADKGDGVLVSRPAYGRFELDYNTSARVKIIYVDMNGVDPFSLSVVERFEDAFKRAHNYGVRIKGLLISNPNNPLGHCYPRETLKALMAFCQRHAIHLICDEIYAMSVFSAPNSTSPLFTSALSINKENLIDPNLVQVLYGLSKDFGLAGFKIGSLITCNKSIIDSCATLLRLHGSSGPSLEAACTILQQPDYVRDLLALSRERIRKGHKIATNALDTAGIPYYRGSNAGFFLYIDLSKYLKNWHTNGDSTENSEFALAQHIKDHGVFLHPREEHNEVPGWFRLVFTSIPHEDLKIGLNRLTDALKKIEPPKSNLDPTKEAQSNTKICNGDNARLL
ncbi:1-aminocyclopropane-1-carboxylate synthase-like protein 1 [Erysiphe neolycopersici]|uniref:1-aminocyclopropane-1-carboxylate synthase-like protein 1 n=1 Tax=Erysiphe neolycopersici TaxID=212602 RepID=A0A420HFC2_9PEZI|nr:1-aminocyclopropane-1-carboxylate synthase-like protein 1 [Erysiphe neolycopersici]